MHASLARTAKLLGQPHDFVVRTLTPRHDRLDDQIISSQPESDQGFDNAYSARPALRSVIKTKLATVKGHRASQQEPEQFAAQGKGKKPGNPRVWSKIVGKYFSGKASIARCHIQCPKKRSGYHYQPIASIICTERSNTSSRPVQYRDIDLGSRREPIYADTIVHLTDDDEVFESNFDASPGKLSSLNQDESANDKTSSGAPINSLKNTSWPVRDLSTLAPLCEPSTTTSATADEAQEDLSRPTTSSTDRKGSGEFLRRLQTGSSAGSWLHSRNISDASAITLPSSEDGGDIKEARAGYWPLMIEEQMNCEAGYSKISHNPADMKSSVGRGICHARKQSVNHGDIFGDTIWPQAPDHVEFASYEMNVLPESNWPNAEKKPETRCKNDEDDAFTDHESAKGLFLHIEQLAGNDDRSYATTIRDEPGVITKSYGEFDAAFTQQVKDYSKLLDDLADPDATAQALELVSNRLSLYLNNYTSSVDVGLVRPVQTDMPEKRQLTTLPGLEMFLDKEDSDWDDQASSTKVFACPVQPKSTPFSDLEQFICDDDLDLDVDTSL